MMTTNNKVTEIFNITNDPGMFFIVEKRQSQYNN